MTDLQYIEDNSGIYCEEMNAESRFRAVESRSNRRHRLFAENGGGGGGGGDELSSVRVVP